MLDISFDQELARHRQPFIDGKPCEDMRLEIRDSWTRCKAMGLNPNLSELDMLDLSEDEIKEKPIASAIRSTILPKETKTLYELLKKYHGALFYTNEENQTVFSQRGNKQLLDYLNSVGLKIGSCLLEKNIGTTALAMTPSENKDSWVIGEEHYLDLFTPYVTYAYFGNYFGGLNVNTLIILPKEHFSDLFIYYLRQYHSNSQTIVTSYRRDIETRLKEALLSEYEQNQEQGIMFIDSFGKILSANQALLQWCRLDIADIKEQDCAELFPELKDALEILKTGKDLRFDEIQIQGLHTNIQHMRLIANPIFQDQNIIGLMLKFLGEKYIRQAVNKLSNAQAHYTFDNILGESDLIKEVKQRAIKAAQGRSPVIITGESGTGKEVFAQAIHNSSPVRNGPFVALNCASISPELLASELFGYVDGAFTGARKGGSMGKFEYAHKGTIFLDEIGELSMSAQSMLLRVLEERKVTRIGSNVETPVDVRLITATNRDLKRMVREKTFRLDLYYRIVVVNLHLPALIERITDIPILAHSFIDYYNSYLDKNIKQMDNEALRYLINYRWPGNVRELRNIIECGMNNASGEELRLQDLPSLSDELLLDEFGSDDLPEETEKVRAQKEKQIMLTLMIEYNGNKTKIAKRMGISRGTLYKKMEEYHLI